MIPANQPDLFDALTARDDFDVAVLPLFEEHRADWLSVARAAAVRLGSAGVVVTIDDVREICPPPDGVDPRVMGAVFTRRDWECLGYAKSRRGICHKRPVGQFRLRSYER